METNNPQILSHVLPHLREKFEQFRQEGKYTSDSVALNGLLEKFFRSEHTSTTAIADFNEYATAAEVEELRGKSLA